jgi:hypothetical protein
MRWMVALALVACRYGFDERSLERDAAIDSTGGIDARDGCEPVACAMAGGACAGDTCEISNNGSESAIRCPAGMPCRISCTTGTRPCRDGVSCLGATTCEVLCIGFRACQDGVDCADSTCTVTCDGTEACEEGILVGPAGTCTSHCCGDEACANGVDTCVNDGAC